MNILKKITDIVMPPVDTDELEQEEELTEESAKAKEEMTKEETSTRRYEQKVANGSSMAYGSYAAPSYSNESAAYGGGGGSISAASSYSESYSRYQEAVERQNREQPHLTVHTTKVPELKVKIYEPLDFDGQITTVVDDIKNQRACVVNYERIEGAKQRRICDFINGACYVLDGEARRISDSIVLYAPEGVDVGEVVSTEVEK